VPLVFPQGDKAIRRAPNMRGEPIRALKA
jgi:hypothetical protein